ncbi:hypothetical protein HELRODRAFT_192393 [Helobdella robusta]|uniref:K Homology domain-containing protein n=1 Tax=Helobdella robusta TaxID=6412 RepID=T1FTW4_HELRO|nr:hypothetical protein HELRODRAFT_192393 [Helobdella robusta]ESO01162.1 hypothetical protein HELRODRAFT_192393 [Helobdella robusta]
MSDDNTNSRDKRSRSPSNEDRRGLKRKFDDRHEVRLIIRTRDAGAIIGIGGENIKRLRHEYKASITVTDSRTPERLVIMDGDEDNLVLIITDIGKALVEGNKSKTDKDDLELKFLIHNSQAGCVIGKAASKLKELRKDLEADIKVFPECCPRSSERLIRVIGKPELVAKAILHILVLLKPFPPRGPIDFYEPSNYDEYMVPDYGGYYDDEDDRKGKRNSFGGGGGRRDRGRSDRGGGRDRDFDRRGSGGGYGGFNNNRNRGRDRDRDDIYPPVPSNPGRITDLLSCLKTTQQVSIPAELAGVIIGKQGSNIRKIRMDTGAEVDLDDADGGKSDRIITIKGNPEQIANAQYLLQMSQEDSKYDYNKTKKELS